MAVSVLLITYVPDLSLGISPYRWDPAGLVKWRFHTHIADLSGGLDEAWGRYRTNAKRNIRKAEAAGIEVRAGTSTADGRAYCDVYEDTIPWPSRQRPRHAPLA